MMHLHVALRPTVFQFRIPISSSLTASIYHFFTFSPHYSLSLFTLSPTVLVLAHTHTKRRAEKEEGKQGRLSGLHPEAGSSSLLSSLPPFAGDESRMRREAAVHRHACLMHKLVILMHDDISVGCTLASGRCALSLSRPSPCLESNEERVLRMAVESTSRCSLSLHPLCGSRRYQSKEQSRQERQQRRRKSCGGERTGARTRLERQRERESERERGMRKRGKESRMEKEEAALAIVPASQAGEC